MQISRSVCLGETVESVALYDSETAGKAEWRENDDVASLAYCGGANENAGGSGGCGAADCLRQSSPASSDKVTPS